MFLSIFNRVSIRRIELVLTLVLVGFFPLGVVGQSLPTITVCNDCSADWQYSQAALAASDLLYPDQPENVYVVNVLSQETRVYQLTLTIVSSGGFGDSFDVRITPVNGDPAMLADITSVVTAIANFQEELGKELNAEELGLSFDSAVDLAGSTGLQRELQNTLTNHYDTFWNAAIFELTDIADSLFDRLIAETGIETESVTVKFEDGTSVRVIITKVGRDLSDWKSIIVEFDVDLESLTAPGANFVPIGDEEFSSFVGTDLDYDLAQELRDLAFLFGVPVVGAQDAQDCTSSWRCDVSRCTVTVSC